ncbi:hypothetical protein HY484_00060 [Candidatus Woesearchaeota archaeon]|nr:hypothetical protein [Candidatus Woesearchaeota archaeon]
MHIKKITITFFVLAIITLFVWWLKQPPQIPLNQEFHSHAYIDIFICGEQKDLPRSEGHDTVHGKGFVGIPLLHTHDDNILHLEGVVRNRQHVSLGAFFDALKVPFDSTKVFNTSNGDLCNDKPGKWKMYVNSKETDKFRDYIPYNIAEPQKQVISIVFDA